MLQIFLVNLKFQAKFKYTYLTVKNNIQEMTKSENIRKKKAMFVKKKIKSDCWQLPYPSLYSFSKITELTC